MDDIQQAELRSRFRAAVDRFVDKVRDDPNILAVIVSGSLAYDVIWERSDIDMTVIVRDQKLNRSSFCILEDEILINVQITERSRFKRSLEKGDHGMFNQSYYSKGQMVYYTDDSLLDYFEELKQIGTEDRLRSALTYTGWLIHLWEKAQKWLRVRKDPLYAQYYLLSAAEPIAHMELLLRGEPISRESIQKAIQLDPAQIAPFYQDVMSGPMNEEQLETTILKLEQYLEQKLPLISKPLLPYLSDREIKTVTMIAQYLQTDNNIVGVLDLMAEKGIIEKVTQMIRLTPKSKLAVEEVGYLYIP